MSGGHSCFGARRAEGPAATCTSAVHLFETERRSVSTGTIAYASANIGTLETHSGIAVRPNVSIRPIADITRRCDEGRMATSARLKNGETLGDRVIKVDHAGEHGAVCIYTAQRWVARWRAPELVEELGHFREHEQGHRALLGAVLEARGLRRCRSYHFCATGGFALGAITGLLGREAIAATTVAIERVVLRHLREQLAALEHSDPSATDALRQIIHEEQEHHDRSAARVDAKSWWSRVLDPVVAASTETVIWLGMRL